MNPVHGLRGWLRPRLSTFTAEHARAAIGMGAEFVDFRPFWHATSLADTIPDGVHPVASAAIDAIVVGDMGDAPPSTPRPAVQAASPRVPAPAQDPASTACMTQGEIASVSGYSGNACRDCGSFAMKRTGTCETCEACGSTSGGCS